MTKQDFKLGYSEYRKQLKKIARTGTKEMYFQFSETNKLFRDIKMHTVYPVCIMIWAFKRKRNITY